MIRQNNDPKQLQSLAAGLLAARPDCVALAPQHHEIFGLLERFAGGHLDAAALRAAMPSTSRSTTVARPKNVAVLHLSGFLTPSPSIFTALGIGTSVSEFGRQVREAGADPSVAAIFVVIDTPGGFVSLMPETAAILRDVRTVKPIVGHVIVINASGGFWLSSNFTTLEATQSAMIGGIGVYGIRVSVVRQLEREGIDAEVFSAGRFKTEGLPVTAITDEERKAGKARVNEVYGDFVADVARGRLVSADAVRSGFGEGRVVSAKEALRLRMIDRVATLDESLSRLVTATSSRNLSALYPIADVEDADRARYERLYGFAHRPRRYAAEQRAADQQTEERERLERLYR